VDRLAEDAAGTAGLLVSTYHVVANVRLLVQMAWCRYLCPIAPCSAWSHSSPKTRSVVPKDSVLAAGCSSRCPAWLPVREKKVVRSPGCYARYRCVHNCPAQRLIVLCSAGSPSWLFALLLVALFLAIRGFGHHIGRWQQTVPDQVIRQLLGRF